MWPDLLHRHTSALASFREWSVVSAWLRIRAQPRNPASPVIQLRPRPVYGVHMDLTNGPNQSTFVLYSFNLLHGTKQVTGPYLHISHMGHLRQCWPVLCAGDNSPISESRLTFPDCGQVRKQITATSIHLSNWRFVLLTFEVAWSPLTKERSELIILGNIWPKASLFSRWWFPSAVKTYCVQIGQCVIE